MSEINENIFQSGLYAAGKIGNNDQQERPETTRRRGLKRVAGAIGAAALGLAIGAYSFTSMRNSADRIEEFKHDVQECVQELEADGTPEFMPLPDYAPATRVDSSEIDGSTIRVSREDYCEDQILFGNNNNRLPE